MTSSRQAQRFPFLYTFFSSFSQTEEEIKKLTLEENMTETKRTMHILTRGQPIQKISVIIPSFKTPLQIRFQVYLHLDKILVEPDAFQKILPLVSVILSTCFSL